jgi:hypothetical protein
MQDMLGNCSWLDELGNDSNDAECCHVARDGREEPMALGQDIVVKPMACFTVFAMRVAVSQFYRLEAITVEHKPSRVPLLAT